ncbi:MAG: type II toxin-antitoxin system Phd/YefM family antitoxin [Sulfuriferula sp.]|nr:type II toxin-antitoxin system Phd/YefM family antitoxin [Sulfuriferula sp.]
MQTIPFSEARAHFAETIQQLETEQQPLTISRRGKAAAVLISPAKYAQLIGTEQNFAARLAQWRINYATELLEADPFTQLRDTTDGRDFSW